MKKILFLLPAGFFLGGCMATVSPAGEIETAYLAPTVEVVPAVTTVVDVVPAYTGIFVSRTPHYAHAVKPRHHFRPAPAPRPVIHRHTPAKPATKPAHVKKPDSRPIAKPNASATPRQVARPGNHGQSAARSSGISGPGHKQVSGRATPGKK